VSGLAAEGGTRSAPEGTRATESPLHRCITLERTPGAPHFSDVSGVTMRSVAVDGLDIDSHDLFIGDLLVNGVDVVPLVDAELNRSMRRSSRCAPSDSSS
jgi:hypothetical protein